MAHLRSVYSVYSHQMSIKFNGPYSDRIKLPSALKKKKSESYFETTNLNS